MFTGIDEVDWASMRHAYGSAEDVPALLRGLASADPAERETALDGLYGAVHHQGDVYDSTLACVPFLFALAECPDLPDRGAVVELLVSIGGEGQGPSAVRDGAEVFARLAGDPDPGVRRTALGALVRFLDRPARVLDLLRERITVERDDRVLCALIESLGLYARRNPSHADAAVDLLAAQTALPYEPELRLAALGQLAGCAPDRMPADLVPTAVRLLRERSERRSRRAALSARPHTDTLVGRLRRLRPSDEEGSQLLRTLHNALDGRTGDRIALLVGQLSSPDWADRCNAVWMSGGLFRTWRADFSEPVALIGTQLDAPEDRLRDAAVAALKQLFGLAAPAADGLHRLVTARPELWVRQWERGAPTLGDPLRALVRCGDPRAVPVLGEVLAGTVVPDDVGQEITWLGAAAAPLAPALRRRLGSLTPDDPGTPGRAAPLLRALTVLRDAEAVPEALRLLEGGAVEYAVAALGAWGSAAREAVPALSRLLDTEFAVPAAAALWSVERDASAVLPVLLEELRHFDSRRWGTAAEAVGRMGPAARAALPELRRAARTPGQAERRATAACALWRIDGEAESVIPVLRSAWTEKPQLRRAIAACLHAMGPAGAPLGDLVTAELAARRRHTAHCEGYGSHDIPHDEELLRLCREVLPAH
ncbi:HEAT repeat domain-containing protein [Streptomyces sp. YS415]|uniref:HEAT repeat domain-containing protein n=1 Tax=Streptomyces sp. YS415 TaxID=2944806 RepID=UPI002020DEC7|nr:HEAT repeat domain-containing protein [Streptomyces sp. YS415]MCL7426599.1 HEAT repeat domain-containing protein [Streptomyces sp. YS415]